MSSRYLRNISISKFESFLELAKCTYIKKDKGHFKYTRADLFRPITFQTHIDPIPEFIVKNNLRTLGYTTDDFFDILECKKMVERDGKIFSLVNTIK